MPTIKPIIPVVMEDDLLQRIDDYRRTIPGRIPSRSEAIRRLVEKGLKADDLPEPKGKKK